MARAVGAATSLRSVGLARRQVISHRQWATADVHHLAPPRHHCRCGMQCGSQLQLHAPTCLAPTRALVECWRCAQWEIVAVPTPTAIRSSARNRQAAQLAVARNNNVHHPALPRRASVRAVASQRLPSAHKPHGCPRLRTRGASNGRPETRPCQSSNSMCPLALDFTLPVCSNALLLSLQPPYHLNLCHPVFPRTLFRLVSRGVCE